jgi:Domain of unknown function (DUF4422)
MVYVVSHKDFIPPEGIDENYRIIYVGDGHAIAHERGLLTDEADEPGLSISEKNANYCELTALYYIWKNADKSAADGQIAGKFIENGSAKAYPTDVYIGLNHYRRYFVKDGSVISGKYIGGIIDEHTVILPRPLTFSIPIKKYYVKTSGYKKDLYNLRLIIALYYPDYLDAFDQFLNGNTMSYANMFVMSCSNAEKYARWLFDILGKLETVTDISGYTGPEQRIYGYLGELLLNVWVAQNGLSIHFCETILTEMENAKKMEIARRLKNAVKRVVYFPDGIPRRRLRMELTA